MGYLYFPQRYGGLGITKVKDTNQAFLYKWLWRYHSKHVSLWKKGLLIAKYKKKFQRDIPTDGKFSSAKAHWQAIIKWKDWFETKMHWSLNNDDSLSFQHTKWCDSVPLVHGIPRFYALSNIHDVSVKEAWDLNINDRNLRPRRPLNYRELLLWQATKVSLQKIISDRGHNKPNWKLNGNRLFSIALVEKAIIDYSINVIVSLPSQKLKKSLDFFYS